MRRPFRPALFAVACLLAATARVGGQEGVPEPAGDSLEVRGRFLTGPTGQPLAGAYLTLVSAGGTVRDATISNEAGWFRLRAPAPGRYTVRAEHIGYSTEVRTVQLPAAHPSLIELRATFQAIELEGITAEVDKECGVPEATAQRVALLWDEVRKAFRVTAFVEDRSVVLFDVDRWTRTLDPSRLTVQEEQRRPRTGQHPGSPFVSLPPETLATEGYVQGDRGDEEIRYYGPDAHVLLDRSFQDAHCFGFRDKGPEPGWVGLQFRPRDKRARDIEGTLWIERATYEPRRLDFRYPQLPWSLSTDKVGGEVDFTRIPEGPWIVDRWWIRMPVVRDRSFRMSGTSLTERRYDLAAVIEEGGEVRTARVDEEHVFSFRMGAIDGVVRDSLSDAPVVGARVGVVGTFFQATTDEMGRFHFDDVPRGRYEVSVSTEDLAVVSPDLRSEVAEVDEGATAEVSLRIPSAAALTNASCAKPLVEDGPAAVVGVVRAVDGTLVPGAEVQVEWDEVRGGRSTGLSQTTRQASVTVDEAGGFSVCGIPADEALRLRAVAPGFRGEDVALRFDFETFRSVDLALAPVDMAEALRVRVLGPDGETPVEMAGVTLVGLGRSLATDAGGTAVFQNVPVGPLGLKVEHAAYVTRTDTIAVAERGTTTATVHLSDRTFELDPITVTVLTPEQREERARGSSGNIKISQPTIQEMMRERGAKNVAEVIRRALPSGVRISPLVSGSNYLGTCIESSRGNVILRKMGSRRCQMVQVVLDGSYLTTLDAAHLVEHFPLSEIVTIEFLSPMEQTFRYGPRQDGGADGMLIINTARR